MKTNPHPRYLPECGIAFFTDRHISRCILGIMLLFSFLIALFFNDNSCVFIVVETYERFVRRIIIRTNERSFVHSSDFNAANVDNSRMLVTLFGTSLEKYLYMYPVC